MKRHKMPDVLKRFPGGEDGETETAPPQTNTGTESNGPGEESENDEED